MAAAKGPCHWILAYPTRQGNGQKKSCSRNSVSDTLCSLSLAGNGRGSNADLGKALQEAMTREALLIKLTDQLRSRLAAYKQENAQLEELLHQADRRASGRQS